MLNTTAYFEAAARDEVVRLLASQALADESSDRPRERHLLEATTRVQIPGLWLDFGVSIGTSTTMLAECAAAADARLYGFDSFSGRPSEVPDNVELVGGRFEDTLPGFVETHPGQVAFAHIDCDRYSSTATVFSAIRERLSAGTVIVFEKLFNYDRYHEHQMRALVELGDIGVSWRYLGYVPTRYAASIILTEVS